MSLIVNIIPSAAFEVIRDRIAEILYTEFENQSVLTTNPKLNLAVSIERTNPFDKTDINTANVSLANGTYDNKSQRSVDGTYTYHIDFYTSSKTTDSIGGDVAAMLQLHRNLAICRAIFENPVYNTLAFARPFIERTQVQKFDIAAPAKDDALAQSMGRISLIVRAPESTELIVPVTINEFITTAKIGITEKGYLYKKTELQ